jgi:N-acetylated-alpha-linked acidic dipeptidase
VISIVPTRPAQEVPLRFFRSPAASLLVLPLALVSAILSVARALASQQERGYSLPAIEEEKAIEARYRALVSTDQIRQYHRYLTAEPHPAGSPRNNELAKWVAEQWRAQGLEEVAVQEYDVLNSTPREISLEMIEPKHFRASLREDPYDMDPDTKNPRIDGAYLGYSASGEVTAPVVYAHSGNPEDYDYLKSKGIDVRGKVVLVRYSNPYSYRGFKALTAQRRGAAAILIYSDPAEDGYKRGPVFPDGPWGPASHIQRGAITYDFLEPGDPLTPGWASIPGAKRISPAEAVSLPQIMGVPLSWRDAQPLLENLGGPVAPESWQGGLSLKYRLGGQRVRVHLKVEMNDSLQPYYVTEARIRGSEAPEQWVIFGNHRDAWVFGGVDPSSGTAALLEMTRALGQLLQQGIRPRRTLVFCSWDGEEYALTGSTEWGEQHADELKKKAVAYLNVDEATSGKNFEADAVGSLAPLIVDISHELPAPSGRTLYDEWQVSRQHALRTTEPVADSDLPDTRIGSGSDHTVFLDYLGIPVVGLTFVGPYGVYHSMYDDFFWMNRFGDPGYSYHALMSQLWGTIGLRLANAPILPFDFEAYGANLLGFIESLDDETHLGGHIDLAPLEAGAQDFEAAGLVLKESVKLALASGKLGPEESLRINLELIEVERNWCHPAGLPGRPWFKHTLYGTRETYAHLELPGLTEAAEAGNWELALQQAKIIEEATARNIDLLHEIAHQLDTTPRLLSHE